MTSVETPLKPGRRPAHDRRSEPRYAASERVTLSFDDPVPTVVDAKLIEDSTSGFRAVHDSKALYPGIEVQYQRAAGGGGRARVIWTHVLNQRRVSGFLIV